MKLLLDTCVWGGARAVLEASGHEVIWAGEWDRDPGDEEILALARKEGRILVTLDKDFGELAVVRREKHVGILRLVDVAARTQAPSVLQVLETHADALLAGAIVTVEPGRLRLRPPESDTS